jgi:hypothetical protein
MPSWVGLLYASLAPTLVMIDRIAAHTTLRLWHRLHMAEKVQHDFGYVFAPDVQRKWQYVACVHDEQIRAIARVRRDGMHRFRFDALASAPSDEDSCETLVASMLGQSSNYRPCLETLRRYQPHWAIACAYLQPPSP